jgi:hypothetical protein
MSTRISARLDDATQAKLESNRALLSLAGIFSGPSSLSERVKEEFTEALDGKHAGHR